MTLKKLKCYILAVFLTVSVYAHVTTHFLDHKLEKSNVTFFKRVDFYYWNTNTIKIAAVKEFIFY